MRLAPDGPWDCANKFVRDWAQARSKKVADCGFSEWFRQDSTIEALIDEQGKLGLKNQ